MSTRLQRAAARLKSYRRLLSYALTDWRGWALLVGVTLLTLAFGLLQPWPMQVLVDHVLGGRPMALLQIDAQIAFIGEPPALP